MPFWNKRAEIDDEDIRSDVAKNCKEGVDPRTALGDWGDYNEDHDDDAHDEANHRAKNRRGFGCASAEETDGFYNDGRPEDIRLK